MSKVMNTLLLPLWECVNIKLKVTQFQNFVFFAGIYAMEMH